MRRSKGLGRVIIRRSLTSQMGGVGYGKGDGIEASELAQVRGEKEAVLRAMEMKHCEIPK